MCTFLWLWPHIAVTHAYQRAIKIENAHGVEARRNVLKKSKLANEQLVFPFR